MVLPSIPDVELAAPQSVPVTPDIIPDAPVVAPLIAVSAPDVPVTPDVVPATPDDVPTPSDDVTPAPNVVTLAETPSIPTTPTIIIDDDTPLAAEVAQVLGARRTPAPTPMVLGARRAKTGDMSTNPLIATFMIMGASATALGMLGSLKKKK
jgi:hypothetical protein